ncbi:MAG: glycosyltransferase family 8 protein [Candidatus Devosia symbiotica]|nr:glycosyltransferase family 8 protein [Candidatus Devosia symbiotica]
MIGTPIHIALTFDDNFWAPAYALMRSICLSSRRRADMVFHLLHLPLSAQHVQDLQAIESEFGARLCWYNLADNAEFDHFVTDLPTSTQWPKVVYGRLLLSSLLPAEVERVIYLDCDMMVRDPIENLFGLDLEGFPLAAVRDSVDPFIMGKRDMMQNRDLFEYADPYFNSGMLLIDLVAWRSIDIKPQVKALAGRGIMSRLYYDQDILNLIFYNNWLVLPWRWNTIDAHAAHEGMNPAILHYTRKSKPWGVLSGILHSSAHARSYRHVMTNELFYRFARHRWQRWWKKLLRLG